MDFSVIQKLAAEQKYASQKNEYRHAVRAGERRHDSGREGRDPDQDRRHPLLPELMGSQQEGDAHGRRQGCRGALRSQRQLRRRGGRQARRAVRRGAHRDRRPHRRVDARPGAEEPGAGAVAQPRELSEGSASSGSSRRCSRTSSRPPGMGWDQPADRSDPDEHAKNRRVEIKVYPAEATQPRSRWPADRSRRCSRFALAAAADAAARRRRRIGVVVLLCGGSRRSAAVPEERVDLAGASCRARAK